MSETPKISVVIPTYRRPDSAQRLLSSLAQQTLSFEQFEVIVVDDGSNYDLAILTDVDYPFPFTCLRQKNAGATIARNFGSDHAHGELLVFIDDDVKIAPEALAAVAEAFEHEQQALVMGTLVSRGLDEERPFTRQAIAAANAHYVQANPEQNREVHFTLCNTQLLAVRREDFYALGKLQDPSGGWPNWDDVDFGYRAHLAGYRLIQCGRAVGEHWDYSLNDMDAANRRWQRACKSAVRLFETHPDLRPHLPMLHDKAPISLDRDPPKMVLKKLFRQLTSTKLVIEIMERAVARIENQNPSSGLLSSLYRWISGGYMYQGYQEGLREFRLAMQGK